MPKKKRWMAMACSICTAVLLALWPMPEIPTVETATVACGELVQSLLLSGTAQYVQQPCISAKNGIVERVHVLEGQRVSRGQLLFSLDTSMEEELLAQLAAQKNAWKQALPDMNGAATALAMQSQMQLYTTEKQLLASVEASSIRAGRDGIVKNVCVSPGDLVSESTILGVIREETLVITANACEEDIAGIGIGAAAVANTEADVPAPLILKSMQMLDPSGTQRLVFEPVHGAEWQIGDCAEVELITAVHPSCALIPLGAIGLDGKVWYVEEGKARCASVETNQFNRTYAAASPEWAGRTVILYPEQQQLIEGQRVQKAGTL